MRTATLVWSVTGTGLQSFQVPFLCNIRAMWSAATQTGGALVSLSGQALASSGLQGSDRTVLGFFLNNSIFHTGLSHPVSPTQSIFVDVKVAGSFYFICELLDE